MRSSKKKVLRGIVKSDKMDKTVVVEVESTGSHPRYGKTIKSMSKFYADNPDNRAKQGDDVEIMETRPLSKLKRWRVVKILQGTKG